jgi:hypothetical protein
MDEAIPLPGGLRVGVDGLVGLLPGVGDLATLAVSLYGITLAARAGASGPLLARMVGNVALDAAVGSIPVLGDIFDVGFKANRRNARLLDAHLDRGTR